MVTSLEGKWSYRGGQFYGGNGHFTGVLTSMEGEWSSYGGGQFKGGRMVMLWRSSIKKGEWLCGLFNGGGHVREVASLMEEE